MQTLIGIVLKWIIGILLLLIGLRFFVIFLQRAPGFFVGLSIVAAGVLLYALYRGSFHAVGLHSRKSILWALVGSLLLSIFPAT